VPEEIGPFEERNTVSDENLHVPDVAPLEPPSQNSQYSKVESDLILKPILEKPLFHKNRPVNESWSF
jgi:hypothetical protein